MANAYYLVDATDYEVAVACAVAEGLPHQLPHARWNNDSSKAIIQAEWLSVPPGTNLGEFTPGATAPEALQAELTKPEWMTAE